MCTNFTPTHNGRWTWETLGVDVTQVSYPTETFPGYAAPIVLADRDQSVQCVAARFGLIPHWAKYANIGRRTYNARTETVAEKPSYRTPWSQRQFAIALLDDFFEPNWETGRAVRWRIRREDGEPMGVASIWDRWTDSDTGEVVTSFSMLTVNADGHPVMARFHRPGDEKRSVVVLEPENFTQWLQATTTQAQEFFVLPRAGQLCAEAAPLGKVTVEQGVSEQTPQLF